MKRTCCICFKVAEAPDEDAAEQLERAMERVGDPDPRNYVAICDECLEVMKKNGQINPAAIPAQTTE